MNQTEILTLMSLPLTGAGNAERLLALLGEDWKYVPQIRRWLRWNGRFWQEEEEAAVYVAAVNAFRELSAAIRSLPNTYDKREMLRRQSVADWLERAEHASKMKDAFKFLENLAKEEYSAFDTEPLLLNVQNGTLNLLTGELLPHDRSHLFTKICAAAYEKKEDPEETEAATSAATKEEKQKVSGAQSDTETSDQKEKPDTNLWEDTVRAILPDPDVRRWMQKFTGYCLTGSTEEEKFLIAYGPGGCGKGTFFETIAAALGDYKTVVPIDTLLAGTFYTNGEGPTPELAKLAGKRYVLSSECNKCRRLDEAKVKLLTGGDTISARRLNANSFEFRPAFKLILQTNHLPNISDSLDNGLRRRLVIIPFEAKIERRDLKLKQKLQTAENLSACLAWCVEGARLWKKEGLHDLPEAAKKAASHFYEENDLLQQWLDERTEPSLGNLQHTKALDNFNQWLLIGGNYKWRRKRFSDAMLAHGFTKVRMGCGYCYENLCLRM